VLDILHVLIIGDWQSEP